MKRNCLGLALLIAAVEVRAQNIAIPPDPAQVVLPDLSSTADPDVVKDGWKHFFFYKADVTFAEAYADFNECYRFLPVSNADISLPMFAPWEESPGARTREPSLNYGAVGDLALAMIMPVFERRSRQSRMRRCLEPRGYVRYALAENSWEKLIDNYSFQSIAMQAKAASGPQPAGQPLAETK